MKELLATIDKLSAEELKVLDNELTGLQKCAEERVDSINVGRQMARSFSKVASFLLTETGERIPSTRPFGAKLEKMAAHQRFSSLFAPRDPGDVSLEKLASAEYYYKSGGKALAGLFGVIFR